MPADAAARGTKAKPGNWMATIGKWAANFHRLVLGAAGTGDGQGADT